MNQDVRISVTQLVMSVSRNAGGIFFALNPLAKSLSNIDVESNVVGPWDEFADNDAKTWKPIFPMTYKVTGPRSLGYSSQIAQLIGSPDVQHLHGIWMYHSFINHRFSKKTNTPYLISPHGMLDRWAIKNSGWKKKIAGYLYEYTNLRNAGCIHALCESEAISIRKFGLKNPICIIPNGVDLPVIDEHSERSNGRKQLLFLGRLHPKKGLAELFDTFAALESKLTETWQIVVAGWGDDVYLENLKKQTQSLGIANQVQFVGPKFGVEKENLYRQCDAFVLPSFSEGLPMSVLEAWSYGKPTLITKECNLPEASLTQASIECDCGTMGIHVGLEKLLRMPVLEQQMMGNRARKLVESDFNWPTIALQMKEVYLWLLRQSARPVSIWDG